MKKFVLVAVVALLGFSAPARAATTTTAKKNYPTESTLEIRDENGNLVGETGVHVGDTLDVESKGWLALSDVQALWFSDPIDLGKHKADKDGVVRFSFEVPGVPPVPGVHTLRLEGLGPDSQFRRVDGAVKVIPRDDQATTTTTSANGNGNGNGNGNNGNGNGNGGGNGSNGGGNGNGNGSSVLGSTLNRGNSSSGGASAYAKTGAFIARTAYIGFALLAIGAALFLAVRKRNAATVR